MLAQGGIDAHIGILGADTVDPGKLLMIGGTSVVHLFHPPAEHPMPGFWGPCPHTLIPDLWLVEGGQVSAGSVLAWLSNDIFQLDGDGTRRRIDEAAARPVNGSGLLTPDYFMGNRAPYLRGAVLGLSLWHDRVALASANVVAQADGLGVPIERIGGTGGGGVPHHRRLRGCAAARPRRPPARGSSTTFTAPPARWRFAGGRSIPIPPRMRSMPRRSNATAASPCC